MLTRLFNRNPPVLDAATEARKLELRKERKEKSDKARDAARAQRKRERDCGKSPLGHVYDHSPISTFPATYTCVGCGKETSNQYAIYR